MPKNKSTDALLQFIDASPTMFHAVKNAVDLLVSRGGLLLSESDVWEIALEKIHCVTRNGSSIVAFRVPKKWDKKNLHFKIIGAHTDSPCMKLKPNSLDPSANYLQWGAEVYGGALYNSWLDRDLNLAGKIVESDGRSLYSSLHRSTKRYRIPQLAIHLDRKVNESGLLLNPQQHLVPVMGLSDTKKKLNIHDLFPELQKTKNTTLAFDLFFYDANPASYGGLNDDFIYAPRLDNLGMTHAALSSFLESEPSENCISVIALFDHEEVGNQSAQGALSNFLPSILERIFFCLGKNHESYFSALAQSFFISADMAHALHPNYKDRHDSAHLPLLNHGPVIKGNAGLKYATSAETSARFQSLCKKIKIPYQFFINRNDLGCGSTIGSLIAASLGIFTVDVGSPMLSMHSAREMAGSADHALTIKAFQSFFEMD